MWIIDIIKLAISLVIFIIVLVIGYEAYKYAKGKLSSVSSTESYFPCNSCAGYSMAQNGTPVLNPYKWPYSGTSCVDNLYMLNKDKGVDMEFSQAPLTHAAVPDHVIYTN